MQLGQPPSLRRGRRSVRWIDGPRIGSRRSTCHYSTIRLKRLAHTDTPGMTATDPGPHWNVDDCPSAYNGTPISWDPERYDTAAMPFIVAIKQHFWSWRIRRFAVRTGVLEVEVTLPSVAPDGSTMISFDAGDTAPADVSEDFENLVRAIGGVLLDHPWRFRLIFADGNRHDEYNWRVGG